MHSCAAIGVWTRPRQSCCQAYLQWFADAHIKTAIIDPGKPWHYGTNESLNGRFRNECLSVEWFRSRREEVSYALATNQEVVGRGAPAAQSRGLGATLLWGDGLAGARL